MNTDAQTLHACIARDPESWRGYALACVPSDATLKVSSDALVVEAGGGKRIVIDSAPLQADTYHVYIEDIATQWRAACGVLDAASSLSNSNAPALSELSVLVVEDDPMTSSLLAHHLKRFGTVYVTKNAREATANNAVRAPDIIFLDIHYKDDTHDGFDVLRAIVSASPDAFVVMFSGDHSPPTLIKALSLGAQGFIAKPFHAGAFEHYFAKLASLRAG